MDIVRLHLGYNSRQAHAIMNPVVKHGKDSPLSIIPMVLVGLVALEHVYILYMEMFAWTSPRVRKVFGTTEQFAEQTKTLAANQGLYNGFLAAGLCWGLLHPVAAVGREIQIFFLACVLVAAVYGGLTAKRSILVSQGAPALLAMLAVLLIA
jgi:putative membrane protein